MSRRTPMPAGPSPVEPPPAGPLAPTSTWSLRRMELVAGGRLGWRRLASRAGTRINSCSYLTRWLILAPVIGVIAGLGAVLFYTALHLATAFFLGVLAGYHVPTPAGEGNAAGSGHYVRLWAIPLVVVLGALCAGWLVFTFAPEAEGHGTDAAIDAVHHNPRGIRIRAVVVKIVASALTIGSGGSGGREGPTAQISAGFGSLLARMLDLSPEDGRTAVSVGIGSGIGAIFGAPLGGAVLAAEIIYRDDFEYSALAPGVLASIVGYAVFGAFYGYKPLFAILGYHFEPVQLAWFALLGALAGGIGLLYSKSFYGVVALSHRLPFTRKLRPALGGLCVGLLALWLPEVLGTGYGWIQKGLSDQLLVTPLYLVILLPLARIVATSLSIGTGGSGGVFGPGMVIGAFTGLALWRIFEPLSSSVGSTPTGFIVVGMMAVFGGISRAPLAVMLMVGEMTGSIALLAPAMVAVGIATFIVSRSDDSIYRSQLRTRDDAPASRLQFAMPLLSALRVDEVAKAPRVLVRQGAPVVEALAQLTEARVSGAPVIDENGLFLGAISAQLLAETASTAPQVTVDQVLDPTAATVQASARLNVALDALWHAGGQWVAVTGDSRKVVGTLAVSDFVRAYRAALRTSASQISAVGGNSVTFEARVGTDSPLVGVPLRDAELPSGTIVLSVQRGDELMFAAGTTRLAEGDVVSVLAKEPSVELVRRRLTGGEEPPEPSHLERQGRAS